jgi:hypothetical protein
LIENCRLFEHVSTLSLSQPKGYVQAVRKVEIRGTEIDVELIKEKQCRYRPGVAQRVPGS